MRTESSADSKTIIESKENPKGAESKVGLGSSSIYRKGASPSGVPDAATLRDSINLLKNAVYERVAERVAIHLPRAVSSL